MEGIGGKDLTGAGEGPPVGGGASTRLICTGGIPLEGVLAGVTDVEALGVDGGGILFGADVLGARAWDNDGV